MNRAARCALLALGFQLAWPLALAQPGGGLAQDPMAGARVFAVKGCTACHTVTRAGPPVAADLRHISSPRSLYDLASGLWNHHQQSQEIKRPDPRLDAREAGDLIAYLSTLDYFNAGNDPQGGQRLFIEKKCVICHQVGGIGGVVGPSLDRFKEYGSPLLVAAAMWNHGPALADAMRARRIERPRLEDVELRDLVAFLRRESGTVLAGPLYLLPGDAKGGRRVFVEKRCGECHRGDGLGPKLAGRGVPADFNKFAAAMWNKAPAMMATMRKREIATTSLGGAEMADLVAYLHAIGYFTDPGNAERGRTLAASQECRICHSSADPVVKVAEKMAPPEGREVLPGMIALAWNHSRLAEKTEERSRTAWRPLHSAEMADLMAFIRWLGNRHRGEGISRQTQAP